MTKNRMQVRALCEAAIMIAMAQILSYIKIWEMPWGGSVDVAMLPMVLFAVRYGPAWGTGAGFVYGLLQYFIGNGISISWTTMIADYVVAYTLMGLGAGLFHGKRFGVYWGIVTGGFLRFISSFVVGATVWGQYMPEEFLGMPMANPWVYSFLYNSCWAVPDICLVAVLFGLLYKPLKKYFTAADLQLVAQRA